MDPIGHMVSAIHLQYRLCVFYLASPPSGSNLFNIVTEGLQNRGRLSGQEASSDGIVLMPVGERWSISEVEKLTRSVERRDNYSSRKLSRLLSFFFSTSGPPGSRRICPASCRG